MQNRISLTWNCSFFYLLKKVIQIISSLVFQQFCISECLFPKKSPILGSLVYFHEKVFHDLFNFKIKNSSFSPSSSVIHSWIPSCQSSIIFPVFQLNFLWNPVVLSFGLFNRHTINCLSREKSDTSVFKIF